MNKSITSYNRVYLASYLLPFGTLPSVATLQISEATTKLHVTLRRTPTPHLSTLTPPPDLKRMDASEFNLGVERQ
jgi:hypothetical protein